MPTRPGTTPQERPQSQKAGNMAGQEWPVRAGVHLQAGVHHGPGSPPGPGPRRAQVQRRSESLPGPDVFNMHLIYLLYLMECFMYLLYRMEYIL